MVLEICRSLSVCCKYCYVFYLMNRIILLKENHKPEVVKIRQFSVMSEEQIDMDFMMMVLPSIYLPLRNYL